jgi:S1-C subfamily serine protease
MQEKKTRVPVNVRNIAAAAVVLALALSQAAFAQAPRPPSPEALPTTLSENARDALARVRPSVAQIKGFFGSNTAQAFHGTGFAVAPDGVMLTNFHVVAQQVFYPEKYRLEYRTPDGDTGKISVLAVDVRHDLAVVRAEKLDAKPLTLSKTVPAKGERAYSIGFPLDVGLTITEGVANGQVEDSFEARIHYSGAINGGMSGGPALNTAGQVIGINVSGYRFEQLVSFLVPAVHARALIDRALTGTRDAKDLRRDVVAQLRGHAVDLLAALQGPMPTQSVAGYSLPMKLSRFMDCNASGDPAPDQPVQAVTINCSAKAGLYVQQGLYSGDIRFSHYVLTTDKLDAWRFSQKLSNLAAATGGYGSRQHVGPFACRNSVIKLKGFDASMMVCARSYRKLEGLYDFTVRTISLNQSSRGFASHLDMHGMDFDAAMQFIRRYVDAMQWDPS